MNQQKLYRLSLEAFQEIIRVLAVEGIKMERRTRSAGLWPGPIAISNNGTRFYGLMTISESTSDSGIKIERTLRKSFRRQGFAAIESIRPHQRVSFIKSVPGISLPDGTQRTCTVTIRQSDASLVDVYFDFR